MNRSQDILLRLLRASREVSGFEDKSIIRDRRDLPANSPFDMTSLTPGDWALVIKEANRHGLLPYLFRKICPQRNSQASIIQHHPDTSRSMDHQQIVPGSAADPIASADGSAPASQWSSPMLSSSGVVPAAGPNDGLFALHQAYWSNISVNLMRFHYFGIALRALASSRVPVIVLKGGYLAEAVYGDIGLRVMSDIDILVRREHLPAAVNALRSSGFHPKTYHLEPPADLQEFKFVHQNTGTMIELHWEIFKPIFPFGLKSEVIWPAAVPAKIAGVDVLALSPEDLLSHLAAHAAIHSYNAGLKVLVDAAQTIDRLPVAWNIFIDRARTLRSVRPVWLMLALSRRLLGAAVPEAILTGLRPPESGETLLEAAQDRIFSKQEDRSSRNVGNSNLLLFFGRKGIRAKLRLVLSKAFPTRGFISTKYPVSPRSPRVFFFYLRWIWTLIKRNGPAVRAKLSSGWRKEAKTAGGKDDPALMNWLISGEE
jgi:hypothetical protein